MAKLDDNILQKYLFINADKIYDKVKKDNTIKPAQEPKIKLLANKRSPALNKKEAATIITRQHELLSANMAPTSESAIELFSDPKRDNYFINGSYTINHNIIFTKNNTRYSFNIDQLNQAANSNPDGFGGKFVFHKITIVNKSKDAFTAKSNFQVTFHIAFNFFEDLKENVIVGTNITSPEAPAENISVLNLLYPYYDKRVPKNISNKILESKTGNGLILNQVLDMSPGANDYFKQTVSALDNIKQIHKNYHLTFHKHSINLFKSGESTLKSFDSELIIDFIAYEADPETNQNKDPNTPTVSNNLFSLLLSTESGVGAEFVFAATRKKTKKDDIFSIFSSVISQYNKTIQNLELAIKCKKEGKDVKTLIANPNILFKNEINPNSSNSEFTEQINEAITTIREKIKKLSGEFSINLFRTIINKLDIYQFSVDSSHIVQYEQSQFFDSFLKTFSGNFETSVGLGVLASTLGFASGGTSVLATVGANAAISAFQAANDGGQVINKGVVLLRSTFPAKIDKLKAKNDQYLDVVLGNKSLLKALTQDAAAVSKSVGDYIEKGKTIKETGQDVTIQFVFFGQLISLINSLPGAEDINIVIGGKTIPQDSNFNSIFLNYYYVPIDYYKLLQFLNTKIVQREGYNYNSEVFLRELVDTFLKETVLQDGVISGVIKDLIPTNVVTSVHLVDEKKAKDFLDVVEDDIIDDAKYNDLKKKLILSKNLEPAKQQNRKLKKIYTIMADEEIKYYNFYAEYDDWRFRNRTGQPNTSQLFQEFITSKYQMPCLRTKAIDAYGSILINKNLHFSRKDNPNLMTGQTIDNSALLRLPYVVNGSYKPYIFFFLDVSSFMFVAPPDKRNGSLDTVDTFGYSGLYLIKNSSFEYNFQLLDNNNAPSFPNEKSKCDLVGQLITYGDGLVPHMNGNKPFTAQDLTNLCTDPQPIDGEPAAQGEE